MAGDDASYQVACSSPLHSTPKHHFHASRRRRPRARDHVAPAFTMNSSTIASKAPAAAICESRGHGTFLGFPQPQESFFPPSSFFRPLQSSQSRALRNSTLHYPLRWGLASAKHSSDAHMTAPTPSRQSRRPQSAMPMGPGRKRRSKSPVQSGPIAERTRPQYFEDATKASHKHDSTSRSSAPDPRKMTAVERKVSRRDMDSRPAPQNNWLGEQRSRERIGLNRRKGKRTVVNGFFSSPSNVLIHGPEVEAKKFLDDVRSGKRMLSLPQFNEVLSTLGRQRRLRDALAVLQLSEDKHFAELISSSKSVKTYTIMIDLFGKAHQLSRAFSLFYGMSRNGVRPNVITYNAMVAACARSNEPDLAYEVFEEMQSSGLEPDKFTYGSLIDSCAKCGYVDRAFEISALMDRNGVVKDQTIYSALMDACGRAQQLERGFQVFEEMKRNGVWPNLITFSVLIDTCANAREPEKAFQLFSEIKHWGFPRANVIVYTALIDACSKAGWPERAEIVMQNMLDNEVKPNEITFGALMDGWAKHGELDQAFGVLERMVNEHGCEPNGILVGGLIDACRKLRALSRISTLWDLIVKYNIRPSRSYYPALITMAAKNGDIDLAVSVALHAYARGSLRRVAVKSENPTLHALACALIFLRHEIMTNVAEKGERGRHISRLRVAFNSTAMTPSQMNKMLPSDAYDYCMTWGDVDYMAVFRQKGGSVKDKHGVYRRDSSLSAAARRAKDAAAAEPQLSPPPQD